MEGTVKFFNVKKGFGFITGDNGTDYFTHVSFLTDQNTPLRDNARVSFIESEGDRGMQAKDVALIQDQE